MPRWMPQLAVITALVALPLLLATADDEPPPPPEATSLAWTAEQGTWMGVDVHPSGDRFVFDLLGDLFELPIGGGGAVRLTSGSSWDTEARYAPDGRSIVFTSDRGGGIDLWLIDADGARPRPLTAQTDSRPRDAAWSPDGEFLAARRRFTDTSSIGVWELWLHDRLGGDGVRVTSRETQAASEPAFSPDGRFVYYSSRAPRYAYNNDPNKGIWQIWRYDRITGQNRPITGEHGGLVRPTPSPDGSRLAVVRRVRARTMLQLLDLATGALSSTGVELDPDDQEGFGVNGNYPRMDWLPDGRHLVAFAGGGFRLIDVETGEVTPIPFRAPVEHDLVPAVRPTRSPVADEVQARLIRWPAFSPDAGTLLFGAQGSLWRMALPDGAPERLTGDEMREFGPSWSPDGRWIAYVTWDDEHGGAVRIVPARGGRSRVVSTTTAKYGNPSFSPDGRSLVVLRGSGGPVRGHDLGRELWSDVVVVNVVGGSESVVAATAGVKRAARPRFSPDGDRVLFPEERAVPLAAAEGFLVSVALDGTDRRDLLKVGHARDVVPSPDGRWVAFTEDHHAWIARLPDAGRSTLEVARGGGAVPVWRLSEVAGDWVDFTPDGAAVSWGYGPEIHRLGLADLLTWDAARKEEQRLEQEAAALDVGGDAPASDDGAQGEEPEEPDAEVVPPSEVLDF
jgi:Tol biopolymer transport system component